MRSHEDHNYSQQLKVISESQIISLCVTGHSHGVIRLLFYCIWLSPFFCKDIHPRTKKPSSFTMICSQSLLMLTSCTHKRLDKDSLFSLMEQWESDSHIPFHRKWFLISKLFCFIKAHYHFSFNKHSLKSLPAVELKAELLKGYFNVNYGLPIYSS